MDTFSQEIELFGTKGAVNGYCGKAEAFSFGGKTYPSNWIVATLKGSVVRSRKAFDTQSRFLSLEGEKVRLTSNSFEGTLSTYSWNLEKVNCISTMEKIYEGSARVIIPKTENFRKQVPSFKVSCCF